MSDLEPSFELSSDISIQDKDVVTAHDELIDQNKYTDATELVNNDASLSKKGFRSSLFNYIEENIQALQIYLLNKTANPDEYYSLTEPSVDFMKENGYLFWIKPIEEE